MWLRKAVDQFLTGYFATCRRSDKTLRAYSTDLDQFCNFLGNRIRMESIRPDVLESWAAELKDAGYASASIRRKFAAVKVFFNYWVRRDKIETSPAWRVRLDLAPEKKLVKVLTVDEVRRLLRQAKQEVGRIPRKPSPTIDGTFLALRNLAIVEVLFATGIRVGELVALRLTDFRPDENSLLVRGKGARQRLAYLPDKRSLRALTTYNRFRNAVPTQTPNIFLNANGHPLRAQSAGNIVTRISRNAEIDRHVTPHMLRHTVATLLLQQGADLRVIQEILGHASITTTQIYTQVTRSHVAVTLEACHPNRTLIRCL